MELQPTLVRARSAVDLAWCETVFSLAEARRALSYLSRVLRDAADSFRIAQRCRLLLENQLTSRQRLLVEDRQIDAIRRLNAAIDECNAAGVHLVNIPRGAVRFKVHIDGRLVNLHWRLGEAIENAWEEWFTHDQSNSLTPPAAAIHNPGNRAAAADPSAF